MEKPYTVSGMTGSDELNATMISCPACSGVLGLKRSGNSEHAHLECSVGHKFSFESLLEAKEEEFERSMWSAIALLANLDMIIQKLLERPATDERASFRKALQDRMAQARLHAEQLRAMVEQIERPNLSFPLN